MEKLTWITPTGKTQATVDAEKVANDREKEVAQIETTLRSNVAMKDVIEALIELRDGKTTKVDAIETKYKEATKTKELQQ